MNDPVVYIILLMYKNWEDTLECLESIFNIDYENYKVILVDNCSPNNELERVKMWASGSQLAEVKNPKLEQYSASITRKPIEYTLIDNRLEICNKMKDEHKLILIQSNKNDGFGAGCNIGIDYVNNNCKFDYIWLLNNDTVVDKTYLRRFLKYAESRVIENRKLGIFGSVLAYYDKPNIIQGSGGKYNKFLGTTCLTDHNICINEYSITGKIPDFPIGASMLVRRDFLSEVGMLCEDYFLYYEEYDWVMRGKKFGWAFDICPEFGIFHKEGGSIGSSSDWKKRTYVSDYYGLRNRKIITRKFHKKLLPSLYLSYFFVFIKRILRNDIEGIRTLVKAVLG